MKLRLLALAIALAGMACENHQTGPSLSFVVESQNLASTSTAPNAASICCCRVRGTVRNTSSIPIRVNLNFEGRTAAGASLGTALDFVSNLQPGASAPYDAAGIFAACSQVATLRGTHIVTGVFVLPPS
jgi:hypothetical protein